VGKAGRYALSQQTRRIHVHGRKFAVNELAVELSTYLDTTAALSGIECCANGQILCGGLHVDIVSHISRILATKLISSAKLDGRIRGKLTSSASPLKLSEAALVIR
jgi:hypothetical protein